MRVDCGPRSNRNVIHLSTGPVATLLEAIDHVFQMSMPRHAFKGDFVVLRPFLLTSRLVLIGFVRLHVMEERH